MKKYLMLLALIPLQLLALDLHGKVIGVTDGDTFTLLSIERQQYKIRLRHIDTPEKRQPFGQRSKQALSDLIYQKQVVAGGND